MQEDFFYKAMKYPVPSNMDHFLYQKKLLIDSSYSFSSQGQNNNFNREKKSKQFIEYEKYINKRSRIWKIIPGIEAVYLCNSMTFNSLQENSDIDVCLISKTGMLWRTRFWSVFFCRIFGISRTKNSHRKRFCLSFYITSDSQDLYSIRNGQSDFYLTYRLAHLVPIYKADKTISIYQHNKWLQKYLPNHPLKHCINTNIKLKLGKYGIIKIIEYLCNSKIGRFFQKILKYIWLPIILYKKKKLGKIGNNIIISDKILKFYNDKRLVYNILIKKRYKTTTR